MQGQRDTLLVREGVQTSQSLNLLSLGDSILTLVQRISAGQGREERKDRGRDAGLGEGVTQRRIGGHRLSTETPPCMLWVA